MRRGLLAHRIWVLRAHTQFHPVVSRNSWHRFRREDEASAPSERMTRPSTVAYRFGPNAVQTTEENGQAAIVGGFEGVSRTGPNLNVRLEDQRPVRCWPWIHAVGDNVRSMLL